MVSPVCAGGSERNCSAADSSGAAPLGATGAGVAGARLLRLGDGSSSATAVSLGELGSSGSFIALLKSWIDLPNVPPISPSLLGPNTTRRIVRRINKWVGAKRSIVVEAVLSRVYNVASLVYLPRPPSIYSRPSANSGLARRPTPMFSFAFSLIQRIPYACHGYPAEFAMAIGASQADM
jgi:hypothetical protein